MVKSFKQFLSEGSYDIKQYAIENGLSYGEDEKEKFISDMSKIGKGSKNDANSAWKSFLVSKEIFKGNKSGAAPKPAAKPAAPAKVKIDGSGIVKRYQKILADLAEIRKEGQKLDAEFKKNTRGVTIHAQETPELYKTYVAVRDAAYIDDIVKAVNNRIHTMQYLK